MKKTILLIGIAVLLGLIITAVMWRPGASGRSGQVTAPPGGDFVLQSAKGPVALHDFRGKVVLLYFGYTWCPDVCPTSLSLMGQALRALAPSELGEVQGIFVSVDPARDTVDRLATYAAYFHPNILGITGTAADVAQVAKQYGAAYHKVPGGSPTEYVVDHTSFTCVIGKDGHIYRVLPHGTAPQTIDAVVREALGQ